MKPFFRLILKETKDIFFSKTALLFLIIMSFIVGYSFFSAVKLYSDASVTAMHNPLYASGFEPIQGVFVPTFGGLFILFSLFLPFVIVPLINLEKKQNTLSILTQIPFTLKKIITAKTIASFLFLLFILLLTLPTIIIWNINGGHIPYNELLLLNGGYLLYGMLVVAVSMFAASLFDNASSASIFVMVSIISSWIIDFARGMDILPFFSNLSNWTLTRMLKYFENGLFSLTSVMYFIFLISVFLILAHVFLRFDLKSKWKQISVILISSAVIMVIIPHVIFNLDVTESHRNSFPSSISRNLKEIPKLEIDIYMKKTDSRFEDYEKNFLEKLKLVLPNAKVNMMAGNTLQKNYGLFVYKVNGKSDQTYSNSEEEVFPIIFKLAGMKFNKNYAKGNFPGYPLVVNKNRLLPILYIYFLLIPLGLIVSYATKKLMKPSLNKHNR